jgi:hypothetical protein
MSCTLNYFSDLNKLLLGYSAIGASAAMTAVGRLEKKKDLLEKMLVTSLLCEAFVVWYSC